MKSPTKEKPKSLYDELASPEDFKKNQELYDLQKEFMGSQGSDSDTMPEGIGEFGLEVTNPVPTSTVFGSIFYMGQLRTLDGVKVEYDRKGSTMAANITSMIDIYKITANGKEVATIYVCPYNQKNSERAPKGFKLAALPFVK